MHVNKISKALIHLKFEMILLFLRFAHKSLVQENKQSQKYKPFTSKNILKE